MQENETKTLISMVIILYQLPTSLCDFFIALLVVVEQSCDLIFCL